MALDKNLIKRLEDAENEKEEFVFSFKKYKGYTGQVDTDRVFKRTILSDYPVESVYGGSTRAHLIPGEITKEEAINLNGLKEEDFQGLNEKYKRLSLNVSLALQAIEPEITHNPLPEAKLNEFQKLFLDLDPYGTKLKKQLLELKNLFGTPIEFSHAPYLSNKQVERFGSVKNAYRINHEEIEEFQANVDKFINSTKPWDFANFPNYRELFDERKDPHPQNPREPNDFEPIMEIILLKKYPLIADTYENALEKMKIFFQDVENLCAIYRIVHRGIEMKELSDKFDVPHKYKNLIWQDGDAIEKKFDIRAIYHFVLLAGDRSINPNFCALLNAHNSSISSFIKKYLSEPGIRPTKTRYYNYTTWKKGPELFNTLKKYIEEK